ncbi:MULTISPECIES: 4-hydroxybenzoate 3-monooxygenase [unclassified Streptomyces]|uniref:4-hydroxybenzoate 3-monooxygenase n=1 Tax=unclassified Streptomyces TaxID=2593676 RepID=UPI002E0F707F|nr:4-hydroxybenzoate 3-monooxygenase [Streptomyces sp. NBC_01197]WSS53006.1 4-hydroxybenzoate 3-monooxygenase [Streptomyces sp. NBC_01180]
MRTRVGIIGAGPAGLLLSHLLHRQGIDNVVLELRTREYVEHRQRAGILEHGTAEVLRASGAGERMDLQGIPHTGVELRFDRRSHRIDLAAGTGGRSVMVYAQTEVVKDLIALREQAGGTILFEAEALSVDAIDTSAPAVRYRLGGAEHTLDCDVVVACDGFHGVGRRSVPDGLLTVSERTYPFAWLGILADVPPSCDELVYAHHERGFALHSMRSPQVSRLYLQVDPTDSTDNWPDERIWDELDARFETEDGWKLGRGPITEKGITPMRSFVAEPMRHGRLFLAGDAAHIVPPTGAKGLNLAVADVTLLARALTQWHTHQDEAQLDAYSETALRRVWRAEHFSYTMTSLLHTDPAATGFDRRLQLSHLRYIASSDAASSSLAENYTGLPFV